MPTILLEQIIELLMGWKDSFFTWANAIGDKIASIKTNTDSLPDIKDNTDDIKDNTAAVITPISNINTNVSSISSDVGSIKVDTIVIKNNASSIATSSGTTAAFAEDIANNTLDCKNRLVTIGSDTTQIRSDSGNILTEQQKIYEGIKWLLSDKYIDMTVSGLSPISFGTDSTEAIAIKGEFSATQTGSGDPSPSNPRPLTGVSSIDFVVNGSTVTIALGDTYYGGYVEQDKEGHRQLVITWGEVDLGNYNYYNGLYAHFNITAKLSNAKTGLYATCKCEKYQSNIGAYAGSVDLACCINNGGYIYFYDTTFTGDAVAFKTAMTGVKFVYELATPITIDLPDGTPINTLSGINNISSTANDNITVDYKESIKYYLEHSDNNSRSLNGNDNLLRETIGPNEDLLREDIGTIEDSDRRI